MLVEKIGLGAKQGKTTKALEQVGEQLLRGKKVCYMTNELTYNTVMRKLQEDVPDAPLFNLVVEIDSSIEEVVNKYSEDIEVAIVADIGKDVSETVCENPLYVYYQKRATE